MSVVRKLMTKDRSNVTVQCNLCSAKFKHRLIAAQSSREGEVKDGGSRCVHCALVVD